MTPYFIPRDGGETVFTVNSSAMKFGPGALGEIGQDAATLGIKRAALFIDRNVAETAPGRAARDSLAAAGVDVAVHGEVRCEPNSESVAEAARFASDGGVDGFVSIGGGSVMDTAKAANLLPTHPDDLVAYVNAPIGRAKPIPGPLKPHIACPTTCGTGSETTGIAVVDLKDIGLKTGISSPLLKPTMAIVDPATTESLPGGVVAATGFDVLSHAVESIYRPPLHPPPAPRPSRPAPALSRGGPLQRHRLNRRHPPGRALSGPRGQGPGRQGSPPPADVRRHPRRPGLRQRRRSRPSRHVLFDFHPEARVHRPRLRGSGPHGAPRDRGRDQLTGGFPFHRAGGGGPPHRGGKRARRRHERRPAR